MRLSNSSFAYFGLFLSQEMERLGRFGTLYTNLPCTRLRGLPSDKYRSQPLFAAPLVLDKLRLHRLAQATNFQTILRFDRWVAAQLTPCDIFHSFSSFGLRTFQTAKSRFDALTIVERGSSHIRFQNEILSDEYARWRVPFRGIDQRMIEREELEYATCDHITVQSTFAERTFLQQGVRQSKLIKLPLGVDLSLFRPADKGDRVFRVLYAGQCSFRKGFPYLLEAISQLRLPNFEFVVTGSVPAEMRPLMARYSAQYRFLGFQPLEKLHEVYSQASVLVLPTIEDGFAKVVTEAMACGVPVIATTNCGALDVLTDGVEGFVVPVRDPAAIKDKILALYENPEAHAEMGRAALERAYSLSNWQRYGDSAARAYTRALEIKRQAPVTLRNRKNHA